MDTHTREGYKSSKDHAEQVGQNGYQSIPEKTIKEMKRVKCHNYETLIHA